MRWLCIVFCLGCAATTPQTVAPEAKRVECTTGSAKRTDTVTAGGATRDRWATMSDKKICTNTAGGSVSSDETRPKQPVQE